MKLPMRVEGEHRGVWLRAAASLWAMLLLCLAAGTGDASAAEPRPLGLGVSHGPVSLLVYVAEAQRYFEQEGLAIRRMKCESGRECLQRVPLVVPSPRVREAAQALGLRGYECPSR